MNKTQQSQQTELRRSKEIEDVLIYLELADRGFSYTDPLFFDGAAMGYKEAFNGFQGIGDHIDEVARQLRRLHGGIIMAPDSADVQFALVGGHELDFLSKQKLIRATGGLTAGDDRLVVDDRIVEVRGVDVLRNGRTRLRLRGHLYHRQSRGDKQWSTTKEDKPFYRPDGSTVGGELTIAFCSATIWTYNAKMRWSVGLALAPLSPKVTLFTDPTGVKEFFKFRDIPEGKRRRDALSHWVSEHWRQKRADPEVEVYVREHLRGQTEFAWHGLQAKIHISEEDTTRVEEAKVKRKRVDPAKLCRRRNQSR